jgi:hypothetical protein
MNGFMQFIKRNWIIIPVVALMFLIIGGMTFLSGTLGIQRETSRQIEIEIATIPPPLAGEPVARYFQVDPAVIQYLDYSQPSYGVVPMDALGLNIQPIGSYLPRSGNTQFQLAGPTALPTVLPYATTPPLPLPYVEQTILPTVAPLTEDGVPRTIPYVPDGNECAPSGKPVEGVLTQRYHMYHHGIDIGVPLGTAVLATHSGQITFAGWSDIGYGYLVIVRNGAFITYYAHNTSFNVSEGQYVGKGSIIAWSGSTGNSSGPHVHYETRINNVTVDPLTFESRGYGSC